MTQAEERLLVEADLVRLTQVLSNLLNNAAKYTPNGGAIRVESYREAKEVVISVTDNGAGMTADVVQRAFELFAQADRTLDRSQGGLGLGLSLARQLAVLHGGTIDASSEGLGKGSKFVLRLPLALAEQLAPKAPPSTIDVGLARRHRVLVVDDNHDAARTLATLLQLEGHEIWVAHDGHEAVAAAQRHVPDVVVLDIGLPNIDGYQVARILRGHAATSKIFLIALTGYGQPEDQQRAHQAGFDCHLVKPVEPAVLNEMLLSVSRLQESS